MIKETGIENIIPNLNIIFETDFKLNCTSGISINKKRTITILTNKKRIKNSIKNDFNNLIAVLFFFVTWVFTRTESTL